MTVEDDQHFQKLAVAVFEIISTEEEFTVGINSKNLAKSLLLEKYET